MATEVDGPADEPVQYLDVVADAEDLQVPSPSGRMVSPLPLTAPIPYLRRPFRRTSNNEPAPRWVGLFLGVCAVLFVPYIVALAFALPSHTRAAHYDAAWVGLDVFELLALGATAWCAWTRSTWISLTSTAAATLLACDAWFDVVTSDAGRHRALAVVAAVVVELPLGAFCLWIARHAEVVQERATIMLLRRSARQAERLRSYEGD